MSPLALILILAAVTAGALVALAAAGRYTFGRMVAREVAGLSGRAAAATPTTPPPPDDLPAPVRRYLAYALPGGADRVCIARMRQTGAIRAGAGQAWMPVTAEQYVAGTLPAFIWHATVRPRAVPFPWTEVRDRYEEGRGEMRIRLLSALPIADAAGPEMDVSSLLRYLGEAPWVPTAFLDRQMIRWEAVDETRARAIITDGTCSAAALFSFDAAGRITAVTTDERYRTVGGRPVRERWTGHFRAYAGRQGYMVPTEVEAEWNLADGDVSYVRLSLTSIEYDLFPPC